MTARHPLVRVERKKATFCSMVCTGINSQNQPVSCVGWYVVMPQQEGETGLSVKQHSTALYVEGLTKDYPGVRAVDNVSFSVSTGTVHCLVGENGAGKSTLIKMLTGALQPTSGAMTVKGAPHLPHNPNEAREGGIATLFQELHVVDELTVLENLTLGMERSRFGFLVKSELDDKVIRTLAAIEPSIDPDSYGVEPECCAKADH